MKKYHCFVSHDGVKRGWLTAYDYCIYCNTYVDEIYNSFSKEIQDQLIKIVNIIFISDKDYFNLQCELYCKYSSCVNGITEEEFIIKGILE